MDFIIVSRRGNTFEYTAVSAGAAPTAVEAAQELKKATDVLVANGQIIVQVLKL